MRATREEMQAESAALADYIMSDMLQEAKRLRDAEPDQHVKTKMRKARYYREHKQEIMAKYVKWREKHSEQVKEYQREYQKKKTTKKRRQERIRERKTFEPAYREACREYQQQWYEARKAEREADPEKMAEFREKKHASYMKSAERQRQRMAVDPEYAAQVRAKRHASYLKRREKILADPVKLEAERARLRRNSRRYGESNRETD